MADRQGRSLPAAYNFQNNLHLNPAHGDSRKGACNGSFIERKYFSWDGFRLWHMHYRASLATVCPRFCLTCRLRWWVLAFSTFFLFFRSFGLRLARTC